MHLSIGEPPKASALKKISLKAGDTLHSAICCKVLTCLAMVRSSVPQSFPKTTQPDPNIDSKQHLSRLQSLQVIPFGHLGWSLKLELPINRTNYFLGPLANTSLGLVT